MRTALLISALLLVLALPLLAAGDAFRPPAVPLVVFDPYMSVWSFADNLTDVWPTHWSGAVMAFSGAVGVDGVFHRFLGPSGSFTGEEGPMQQLSVQVDPMNTYYAFEDPTGAVSFNVTFTTPAYLGDLTASSLPASIITVSVASLDGQEHKVQVYMDHTAEVSVNNASELVEWQAVTGLEGMRGMRIGSAAQDVLGESGDFMKINWGYAYFVTAEVAGLTSAMAAADTARGSFVGNEPLPANDTNMPRPCDENWPVLAYRWDLGVVGNSTETITVAFAYDDIYSIQYFGRNLRAYWKYLFNNNTNAMLEYVVNYAEVLVSTAQYFDQQLLGELAAVGPDEYVTLAALAYRQVTGGIKVVWDDQLNQVRAFMKEISSDGDVSTVDVIYPASPFFLYNAPQLLRYMLLPLLDYANNATSIPYNLSWAPHHLGVWPICDILPMQQEQMPMEETGNMLLMLAAIAQQEDGDIDYLQPYWPLLQSWAEYLNASLPDPGDQLCTDDFEGPSPHNANLAVKGILGLAAYSVLLDYNGQSSASKSYLSQAKLFAAEWMLLANDATHYRLQYNLTDTWSLKYNLLFQYILGVKVFPHSVIELEEQYYLQQINSFGIPLDDRATFTKSDWQSWIGAIASNQTWSVVISSLYKFADSSLSRIPFGDWYDTITGLEVGFRARPVMGGIYAKMLLV